MTETKGMSQPHTELIRAENTSPANAPDLSTAQSAKEYADWLASLGVKLAPWQLRIIEQIIARRVAKMTHGKNA